MAHVFISYARADSSFAQELKKKLEQANISAWLDQDLLQPGEDWRKEIDTAIQGSFALIAVMTPHAFESKYVTYEWAYALGLGIKVIPIMLERTSLHPRLDVIQYLDFTNHWQSP